MNRLSRRRCRKQDDVAQFIARIERSDKAFQRALGRAKVRAIRNFYETAISQPPIPGTVLLFTPQKLRFQRGQLVWTKCNAWASCRNRRKNF